MQKTFVMIKPNGVLNGFIGNILNRYEFSGLSVNALRIRQITRTEAEEFYGEHKGRDFYEPLIEFMISGPTVTLVLGGENAVKAARAINGATNPANAEAGTIRYDFAPNTRMNVVHSSDSPESAAREIAFWFNTDEIVEYKIARHTAM
jgi:nucleoside-diphosphate kinase